jgi:hypothetical protein
LRPFWTNSHETPISRITKAKWTGGVAQVVERLLCKHKTLIKKPQSHQNQEEVLTKLGMVRCACDPSCLGGGGRWIEIQSEAKLGKS